MADIGQRADFCCLAQSFGGGAPFQAQYRRAGPQHGFTGRGRQRRGFAEAVQAAVNAHLAAKAAPRDAIDLKTKLGKADRPARFGNARHGGAHLHVIALQIDHALHRNVAGIGQRKIQLDAVIGRPANYRFGQGLVHQVTGGRVVDHGQRIGQRALALGQHRDSSLAVQVIDHGVAAHQRHGAPQTAHAIE